MVGVELNPGQATCRMYSKLNHINFGLINAFLAVNKTAIIHDIISDECGDLNCRGSDGAVLDDHLDDTILIT